MSARTCCPANRARLTVCSKQCRHDHLTSVSTKAHGLHSRGKTLTSQDNCTSLTAGGTGSFSCHTPLHTWKVFLGAETNRPHLLTRVNLSGYSRWLSWGRSQACCSLQTRTAHCSTAATAATSSGTVTARRNVFQHVERPPPFHFLSNNALRCHKFSIMFG